MRNRLDPAKHKKYRTNVTRHVVSVSADELRLLIVTKMKENYPEMPTFTDVHIHYSKDVFGNCNAVLTWEERHKDGT